MNHIFRDLGQKAADEAKTAILRTVHLAESDTQAANLYFSVVLSLCAHMCWIAHKTGGGSYESIIDKVAAELRDAEKEYLRQEQAHERPN